MNLKQHMYNLLVNENAKIGQEYNQYRHSQPNARCKAWLYLLKLNIQYRNIFGTSKHRNNVVEKNKMLVAREAMLSKKKSPLEFAKALTSYDIVSFDVFDTLIFRPFSKPSDMFFFTGSKLNYLNFEQIRIEMEELARKYAYKERGTHEVSFAEIWGIIEENAGIDSAMGMKAEWEDELQFCFANPYMLQVIRELQLQGKQIILTSDMYLGATYIRKLLQACGYKGLDECFVSCDYTHSKSEGTLYEIVKEKFKTASTFVHVGDNFHSDKKQAEKHGFTSIYYENVNRAGLKYRPMNMSVITGSIYRGLVNSYLHNGLGEYSKEYEFGFIYGGLFVLGYCQWIHEYARRHALDKILFLSRDGNVLSKAYHILYPQKSRNWEYVYWSRYVSTKLAAKFFKYDYFQRFLYQKINQNYTLQTIFETMELQDMLNAFLKSTSNIEKYTIHSILNHKLADNVKDYLLKNWECVLAHYSEELDAGCAYYQEVLKGCKKVAAVDVGWAGSGPISLNYVVNDLWKIDCDIIGLIAGTNSVYSKEQNASEALLYKHQLESYLFSQAHNRDIWLEHNPGKGDNLILEALLSAKHGSLRKFVNNDAKYICSEALENTKAEEIQTGILDFVKYYVSHMKETPEISGRDAFAPIALLEQNRKFIKQFSFINEIKMNVE
jgi:Predicted hydrolase (HAD superfamily)